MRKILDTNNYSPMTEQDSAARLGHRGTTPPGCTAPRKTLSSHDLLAGHRDVIIVHRCEVYCLRETRQGKLILTK